MQGAPGGADPGGPQRKVLELEMTLVYLTVAWAIGLILASMLRLPAPVFGFGVGLGVVITAWLRARRQSCLIGLLLVAVSLGALRWSMVQPTFDAEHLAHYNDIGQVTIRGHISAEPSVRDTYTQLQLSAEAIEIEGQWQPVRGKAVLNVAHYPSRAYGDRVLVSGLLETPPILDTFSYKDYLAAQGVHSMIRRGHVVTQEGRAGSLLLRWILARKAALREVIESILPQPDAGLLSGILLGLGHTLPDELAQAFRATGLTHIIVISGYNFSLIAQAMLISINRWAHRWKALWATLGAIVFYMCFVGPSPPVVRAALMIATFVIGQLLGRKTHALTSLAWATLLMTAANPLLLWSVSFQLSFAATLALIALEPVLARSALVWLSGTSGAAQARARLELLREVLLVTLAAQIVTFPIIWYHFHEVSVVALLANALVLPVQPAVLLLGFAATVVGSLWLSAGQVGAWAVWPFLRYCILVVQGLGRLPWASVRMPQPSLGALALVVVTGVAAFLFLRAHQARSAPRPETSARGQPPGERRQLLLNLGLPALFAFLVWSAALSQPDGLLHVLFLDVGQGDAILIRTPSGRAVLVDGGPDPLLLGSRLGQILPFWQRRLDLVIATHADADHLAGLIPIMEHYRVEHALEPPGMADSALSDRWHELIADRARHAAVIHRGMSIDLDDGLSITVLHPGEENPSPMDDDASNRGSLVLLLSMGRLGVLLTADIDAEVERALIEEGSLLRAPILKVAHHGAAAATQAPFLAAVDPQVAIISVGQGNAFGHPSPEVLERLAQSGCQVLRTDEVGTIEVISDGQRFWIKYK
ncbi:MAG: ComEC/Rec2 family competence protein [Anaerolineae bacterium]|nr:ComEC/Rec2 family competence protein [Anaerolineae bacterium]